MNIRSERIRMGFTVDAVANKIGVSKNSLLNYERGDTEVPGSALKKMAALYGCSTDYLLGMTEERVTCRG